MVVAENDGDTVLVIRQFNPKTDREKVEKVERSCEVGPSGEYSLHADLLGDPVCRVRNSPAYLMLVAEMVVAAGDGDERMEIVGMIRGCIKSVTCGRKICRKTNFSTEFRPVVTKLAYILGLRVSPSYRRMKIGLKLVCRMEDWFRDKSAEYSYIATDAANKASVTLFTQKCGYTRFRNPSVLVHPVFAHPLHVNQQVTIIKLSSSDAEIIYRHAFSTVEFFPSDIDSILTNNLNIGTFLAIPKDCKHSLSWVGSEMFLSDPPDSWAIMSVWNCNDLFKLEVKGASWLKKGFVKTTRVLDQVFPFLNLPSLPQIFNPFGFHLLYGLGGVGPSYLKLAKALFGYAHNLAKKDKCGVVVTEVSSEDPLKLAIPHWKVLSFTDLWCIKRLDEDYSEGYIGDWRKSQPDVTFFLDPREF
ncbi:hypothetical protein QVD17_36854 [Tagetes erecta]|uniref:N-acetyltransferase domain-containing protein n=1 Tax=Tagetes erecta TaxID=13708 RepID=A0AAD8JT70_TARER|nr:hypothetical protein QVD17_36854 [Tagetes erecta]